MMISTYKEKARQLLDSGSFDAILGKQRGLFWRTHDYGTLSFGSHRLPDGLRTRMEAGLGLHAGGRGRPDRAVCFLRLTYLPATPDMRVSKDSEEDAGLPGRGCLVKDGEGWLLFSSEPREALLALLHSEAMAKQSILDRVIGLPADESPCETTNAPVPVFSSDDMGDPCGRCSSGLLGGQCDCLGSSCVQNGAS
jgi:hypothetical protein